MLILNMFIYKSFYEKNKSSRYEKDNNGQIWVFLYGTKEDVR